MLQTNLDDLLVDQHFGTSTVALLAASLVDGHRSPPPDGGIWRVVVNGVDVVGWQGGRSVTVSGDAARCALVAARIRTVVAARTQTVLPAVAQQMTTFRAFLRRYQRFGTNPLRYQPPLGEEVAYWREVGLVLRGVNQLDTVGVAMFIDALRAMPAGRELSHWFDQALALYLTGIRDERRLHSASAPVTTAALSV